MTEARRFREPGVAALAYIAKRPYWRETDPDGSHAVEIIETIEIIETHCFLPRNQTEIRFMYLHNVYTGCCLEVVSQNVGFAVQCNARTDSFRALPTKRGPSVPIHVNQ